jgi:hypothetical protein
MMHRINVDESRANQRLAQQSKELAEQSKELSELTAILARQTSADSASMITIAVMTMFFLPATFISVRSQTPLDNLLPTMLTYVVSFQHWLLRL